MYKISTIINFAALTLSLTMVLNTASAQFMDRVLVVVNEDVITQSELDYRMVEVEANIQQNSQQNGQQGSLNETQKAALSKQVLESMVSELLQVQEAERRGISVSDAEVELAIERFAAQDNITAEQLRGVMAQRGDSVSRFTKAVRDSLNISRLTEYYARSQVVVPDYEIDGFIAQNDIGEGDTEYQIAHLLIKNPDTNQELAEDVLTQIRSGLNFQEAVLTYSEATDAQEGGLLGWRTPAQLPEIFATAIKNVNVGQVTDVLRSDNGLHILKLLDIQGNREEILQHEVRHILITATTDIARSYAKKRLVEVRQRINDGESFESLARIYSDDSVSAANGGELGWVSPGEMVPQFESTFNQVGLNQISEPFDTSYGVHILEVRDRRTKNITEDLIRAQADNILRQQRTEREFQQWVRELEQESYIQYLAEPA